CPHCGAFAHQVWTDAYSQDKSMERVAVSDLKFAHCSRCKKYSMWLSFSMIYPVTGNAPLPHPDLPWEIKQDYDEARNIVQRSPRSAAALLRLAIEKLTNQILDNEKGK